MLFCNRFSYVANMKMLHATLDECGCCVGVAHTNRAPIIRSTLCIFSEMDQIRRDGTDGKFKGDKK